MTTGSEPMSTGRVLWIIWCLLWAGSWLFGAVVTLFTVIGALGCLLMAALSAGAIFLPVGTAPRQPQVLPPCYRCGQPAQRHASGFCPSLPQVPGAADGR